MRASLSVILKGNSDTSFLGKVDVCARHFREREVFFPEMILVLQNVSFQGFRYTCLLIDSEMSASN